MTAKNDATTQLNPATVGGGTSMDESRILSNTDADNTTDLGHRPRVVIGGERSRDAVVEPVLRNGVWCVPTYDEDQTRALNRVANLLEQLVKKAK